MSLNEAINLTKERAADLVALDNALTGLAAVDPKKSRIVELQYFGGQALASQRQLQNGDQSGDRDRRTQQALQYLIELYQS